jgi:hypothetical protein
MPRARRFAANLKLTAMEHLSSADHTAGPRRKMTEPGLGVMPRSLSCAALSLGEKNVRVAGITSPASAIAVKVLECR